MQIADEGVDFHGGNDRMKGVITTLKITTEIQYDSQKKFNGVYVPRERSFLSRQGSEEPRFHPCQMAGFWDDGGSGSLDLF
jgi:hypothetical protein